MKLDDWKHQKILEEYMAKVIGFPDEETFKTLLPETYPELYKKIADISSLKTSDERYEARMNISIDNETAEKFMEKINVKTYEDMLERVKLNPKYKGHADDRIEYQARIPSFLAERLSTLYWIFCSKQCPIFPGKVKLLEEGQKI